MVYAQLLVMVVFLQMASVSSLPNRSDLQEGVLSSLEKNLIMSIVAAIPGDNDLRGGGYYISGVGSDWTIARSISDESQATPRELEMIRRIADSVSGDANRSGGGDWTIVKSIELDPSQFDFGKGNMLEPTQPSVAFGGGSIDAPSFNLLPPLCQEGFRFIRGRCRMTFL